MVIGVRSSWPTSLRNRRWVANACSSRSSIALNVRARRATSSSPSTSMRWTRSRSLIDTAVCVNRRIGARMRPAPNQATPAAAGLRAGDGRPLLFDTSGRLIAVGKLLGPVRDTIGVEEDPLVREGAVAQDVQVEDALD